MSTSTATLWQQFFFAFVTIADLCAALVVAWGLVFARMNSLPASHKLGLVVVAFGLMWQAWRNVVFLITGHMPSDVESPFWALKDLGFFIICISAVAAIVRARASKAEAVTSPQPKRKPGRGQARPVAVERRREVRA